MKLHLLCFFLVFLTASSVTAQEKYRYTVRDWVRDSLPLQSDTVTDLHRLDLIYLRAMQMHKHKPGAALFACLAATLRHSHIPLIIGLKIPLTGESKSDFKKRTEKLPAQLLGDNKAFTDADKLQHFFASGWLVYTFQSESLANMLGFAVELGETVITAGNSYDKRDLLANSLGRKFAWQLENEKTLLPSTVFSDWNRQHSVNNFPAGTITR